MSDADNAPAQSPTRDMIEALRTDPLPPATDPQEFQAMFKHGRAQWNGAIAAVLALVGG